MIRTDGQPTIAHRGSLPGEVKKKALTPRPIITVEDRRELDRVIVKQTLAKVIV